MKCLSCWCSVCARSSRAGKGRCCGSGQDSVAQTESPQFGSWLDLLCGCPSPSLFPPVRPRLASRAADIILGGRGEVPRLAPTPGVAVRAPTAVHRGGSADHALAAGRRLRAGGSQQPGRQLRGCASARGLGRTAGEQLLGRDCLLGQLGSKQHVWDAAQKASLGREWVPLEARPLLLCPCCQAWAQMRNIPGTRIQKLLSQDGELAFWAVWFVLPFLISATREDRSFPLG